MATKTFYQAWKSFAVGSGVTILVITTIGSAVDKNPVMTLLLGALAFGLANAVFAVVSVLVDKKG